MTGINTHLPALPFPEAFAETAAGTSSQVVKLFEGTPLGNTMRLIKDIANASIGIRSLTENERSPLDIQALKEKIQQYQNTPFQQTFDSLYSIVQSNSFSLPADTPNEVFGLVYHLSGSPETSDLEWGRNNALRDKHLFVLATMIHELNPEERSQFNEEFLRLQMEGPRRLNALENPKENALKALTIVKTGRQATQAGRVQAIATQTMPAAAAGGGEASTRAMPAAAAGGGEASTRAMPAAAAGGGEASTRAPSQELPPSTNRYSQGRSIDSQTNFGVFQQTASHRSFQRDLDFLNYYHPRGADESLENYLERIQGTLEQYSKTHSLRVYQETGAGYHFITSFNDDRSNGNVYLSSYELISAWKGFEAFEEIFRAPDVAVHNESVIVTEGNPLALNHLVSYYRYTDEEKAAMESKGIVFDEYIVKDTSNAQDALVLRSTNHEESVSSRTAIPVKKWFDRPFAALDLAATRGENVLIHCQAGMSRSVTILVAWMMNRFDLSLDDALTIVKAKRKEAQPNPGFIKLLREYETRLNGYIPTGREVPQQEEAPAQAAAGEDFPRARAQAEESPGGQRRAAPWNPVTRPIWAGKTYERFPQLIRPPSSWE